MIRIAHAYDNLLNLYGSHGNIMVLERYLNEAGYETKVSSFTTGQYMDISQYDLVYFGAGTERNMILSLLDFRRYFSELKEYLEDGRKLLVTGNSMAIFGNSITDINGKTYEGAELIDITTTIHTKRTYSELVMTSNLLEQPVIGNINSSVDITVKNETPMFTVIKETSGRRRTEGVQQEQIFATEVSGPLLVRNPFLLHKYAELLVEKEIWESQESWFSIATAGYTASLAALKRELKIS